MEPLTNIILNVKAVPAFDTEKMCQHTAYTVYQTVDGQYTIAGNDAIFSGYLS